MCHCRFFLSDPHCITTPKKQEGKNELDFILATRTLTKEMKYFKSNQQTCHGRVIMIKNDKPHSTAFACF